MASRNASRMVMVTISVPGGTSGSGSTTAFGATGAGSSFGAGADFISATGEASSAAFCDFAGVAALPRSELLSPSARMVAIGVLTATSAVPSGISILPSVPSSVASTSMVALSVSISAITSPDLIASPSFFSHFERLPFSMVGDSVDDLAHLRVDRLQFLLAHLRREQTVANLLDRVLVVANLVDLLAGAVLRRVRHRMATVAIGLHFQDEGALALTAPRDRPVAGGLHRADVHAVDLLARNVEGDAALGKIGLCGRARYRGAHRVAVVLDDVDHRELPQL